MIRELGFLGGRVAAHDQKVILSRAWVFLPPSHSLHQSDKAQQPAAQLP